MKNKYNISDKFTIEDIHKIREQHYEETKHMPVKQIISETNKRGSKFLKLMESLKNKSNSPESKLEK